MIDAIVVVVVVVVVGRCLWYERTLLEHEFGQIAFVFARGRRHVGSLQERAQVLELELHELVGTRHRIAYLRAPHANAIVERRRRIARRRRRRSVTWLLLLIIGTRVAIRVVERRIGRTGGGQSAQSTHTKLAEVLLAKAAYFLAIAMGRTSHDENAS